MVFQWTGNNPINIDSDFTVVFIRHCESCANIVGPTNFKQKFARSPLCTPLGIKQSFRAGSILPLVLQYLGLQNNLSWFYLFIIKFMTPFFIGYG